jgi:ribosomal protein S12 methylthiotransferase accessory factor YcaO
MHHFSHILLIVKKHQSSCKKNTIRDYITFGKLFYKKRISREFLKKVRELCTIRPQSILNAVISSHLPLPAGRIVVTCVRVLVVNLNPVDVEAVVRKMRESSLNLKKTTKILRSYAR